MGLPWFDNGLWPQVEGPSAAIHFLTAILSLIVGTQLAIKNEIYLSALRSPVVLALFGFALYSTLLLPFSDDPSRSLNGTLKHGVGVLWQFEMAVATLACAAIWRDARLRRVAVWSSVVAVSVVLLSYVFPENPIGTPLAFAEWSGLLGAAVGGAVILAGVTEREEGAPPQTWLTLISVGVAVVAAAYLVSDNRAVLLGYAAISGLLAFSYVPVLNKLTTSPSFRVLTVISAAIAISVAIFAAAPLIESRTIETSAVQSSNSGSKSGIDGVAIHETSLGTIWSRSYLQRVQVLDILSQPTSLLTGFGFGRFSTAYEYHMREVPGRLFPTPREGASLAYWDAHTSANFHSHNMLSETVASVGVPGAAIWLLALGFMAWASLGGAAAALGIVVVGSFWFPLNHMVGALALLTAATAPPRHSGKSFVTVASGCGSLIAVMGLALFGYYGSAAAKLGIIERSERGFTAVAVNSDIATCGFIRTTAFPEKEIVIDLYTILQARIGMAGNPPQEIFNTSTNIISINCMLRRYFERDGSVRALAASLKGRSLLVQAGPVSFGALRNDIINWGSDLELMLDMAPERTELVPPYITVLSERSPKKAADEIARFLPRLSTDDPVRHYLLAIASKIDGDPAGYETHFRKAVEFGFANLWPVDVKALKVITWR
jgi:hypothetical protein